MTRDPDDHSREMDIEGIWICYRHPVRRAMVRVARVNQFVTDKVPYPYPCASQHSMPSLVIPTYERHGP